MSYLKYRQVLAGLVCGFLIIIFSIGLYGNYVVITCKGKVKLKRENEFIWLKEGIRVPLGKADFIMAYPDAVITIRFPDDKSKVFSGPFYATAEEMGKGIKTGETPLLSKPSFRKSIREILDRMEDVIVGPVKGDDLEGSLNFYNEIKEAMAKVPVEDSKLSPGKKKEMEKALASINGRFSGASLDQVVLIKSILFKQYGMHRSALMSVFNHYEHIMKTKGKQKERELLEDFLFNEFLPIRVVIETRSPLTFSSNFDLWWAAFRYNGEKLEEITKTRDDSLHPQDTFKLEENMVKSTNEDMEIESKNKVQCVFIVACADWDELEKYDKIEYAEKQLLEGGIKETTGGTVRDYSKVIIKLCFKAIFPDAVGHYPKAMKKGKPQITHRGFRPQPKKKCLHPMQP
jgi:hypothetical protein